MIRQHGKLTFLSFLLVVLCGNTFAQKIPVIPLDLDSFDNGRLCYRKSENPLRFCGENYGETNEQRPGNQSFGSLIRGRVPGLTIQRGTNGPAGSDAVRLRGTTSLTSGNDPLIIVDGVFGDLSMLTSIYPHRYRKFHDSERCFRNGTIRFTWCFRCD